MKVVKALPGASSRTKNRIKENGPYFHLGREIPVVCFGEGQVKARLLHSASGRTDWVGWLPADEIVISDLY